MAYLLAWVKKLAVFMILCSYMGHLLPDQYKRYWHMCTGLILIWMITTPLFQMLHGDMNSEMLYLLKNLRTGSSVYQMDVQTQAAYRTYYMTQYREAVTEQILMLAENSGLKAEDVRFLVDENEDGNDYGRLTQLSMCLKSAVGDEADDTEKRQFRQLLSEQLGLNESDIHLK